jgi:hypothetical protein
MDRHLTLEWISLLIPDTASNLEIILLEIILRLLERSTHLLKASGLLLERCGLLVEKWRVILLESC